MENSAALLSKLAGKIVKRQTPSPSRSGIGDQPELNE
jgi:hypothetical protein